MQDVLPPSETRSIRKIPVPPGRKKVSVQPPPIPDQDFSYEDRRPRRGSLALWIVAGVIVCALVGLLLMYFFEGAEVTVHARQQSVTLSGEMTASPDAPVGELSYKTISIERTASRTVPATGSAHVERRATGQITIYNAYSKDPQKLIKNTRFETPDGKIYRIGDSITVPGATTLADKSVKPGEITVEVAADSPGPSYNNDPTTFTIPGFKGDPRYDKFYAKSVTALTGGFSGEEPIVSEDDLDEATAAMQSELLGALGEGLTAELPAGYLAIQGAAAPRFESAPREVVDGGSVKLSMTGTLTGAIIREKDFAAEVATQQVVGYQGESLLFADPKAVALSIATAPSDLGESALTFSIAGEPMLVWQFDQTSLKNALAGKDRSAFDTVIESYKPAISRADASIRPFFKGSFPENPDDITVTIAGS